MNSWAGQTARTALFLSLVFNSGGAGQCSPSSVRVWHFDQGVANRWGGEYNVYSREPSWARTYLDPNVHRRGSKHSLRVTAHREPAGFCGVWLEFYPASVLSRQYLDASSSRYLSFWVKGQKGGESFTITLDDSTWQQPGAHHPARTLQAYWPRGASMEWQEVLIPLADFRGLNLRRLVRLTLNLEVAGDSRFYLDDVAFKYQTFSVRNVPKVSPATLTETSGNPRRALWAWNTQELFGSAGEADKFLEFCSKTGVNDVFLSLDLDYAAPNSGPHFDLRGPDRYRKFLQRAHQQGIEVEALAGMPEWAVRENYPIALAAIDAVLDFNRSASRGARFDGIHFDVEPYSLAGYAGHANETGLLEAFLQMVSLCAARIRSQPGLRFNCDVPAYFYPSAELERQSLLVRFQGEAKSAGEHLTDLLDSVTIMDYHNQADGANGAIAAALPALRYASSKGKTIFVGLETSLEPDRALYFVCGMPRDDFRKRLDLSGLGNHLFFDGQRLAFFSDDINTYMGLVAPAKLADAERESFDKSLFALAKQMGAASGPESFSDVIFNEARAAMAQDAEWKDFARLEISDPETHRSIKGFLAVHRMSSMTTFHGLGREAFDEETRSVVEWLRSYPSFGGVAIHFYDSYRELMVGE